MTDLKFAFRQLRKSPGFTAVAVLTLALGIGANTAIFSIVHGVLLRPLPFQGSERIVMVWESSRDLDTKRVALANFVDWQKQNGVFEAMACSPAWNGSREFNLVGADGSERVAGAYVSSGFFAAFGTMPRLGRTFLPEEDKREASAVAVLSHSLWQRRFGGNAHIIGQTMRLDNYWLREFTIVGVMPAEFKLPGGEELWISAGWMMGGGSRRAGGQFEVVARMKPGVTLAQAQAEMNTLQARIAQAFPETGVAAATKVVPLLQEWVGSWQRPLLVLSGAVGLVLLIACANISNLMLARAVSRQNELAVRLALGAGRWRVIRQLLTEGMLLALLGALAGTFLAHWAVHLFVGLGPGRIPRLAEVTLDGTALAFTALSAGLAGVLFGLAPAWKCSRPDLNETLKSERRGWAGAPVGSLRHLLVVVEVALATVLLVGAGLLLQSFSKLLHAECGVRAENVLTAELDFSISGFTTWTAPTATRPQVRLKELLERLRQLPGVQTAGAANEFFRRDNRPALQPFAIFGRPPLTEPERPTVHNKAITPGYLQTVGMGLQRGRDVTEADLLGGPGVVLVNESFVRRFFPNEEPVGQHLTLARDSAPLGAKDGLGLPIWSEIVGVVRDVKSLTTQPQATPEIYWSYWQWPMQRPTVFVRAVGDAGNTASALLHETKKLIPHMPSPNVRRLTDRVSESIAQPRFQAGLMNLFGAAALFLAAGGVYGVLAYGVAQRQREIGIRMALGAAQGRILSLMVGQGLRLVLAGLFVGMLASLALTRVLRNLLYEVQPYDPSTFLGVPLLLALVALAACWLPARRAAGLDPMEALRHE